MKEEKLKIGIFSLTSCEGCCFAILDLREKFLELSDKIEIAAFRLFEDGTHDLAEGYDIALVEGSPLTNQNIKNLKLIRKNSKVLIALGSCACLGGVYHMKNYQDKEKIFNQIYREEKGIENFNVLPINKIVSVDFYLPGCPITAKEFLHFFYQIIIGKNPTIAQNPVCDECQIAKNECLLQKNEICLGPITQGGCKAVCLQSKQGCWGCRGLVEDAEVSNLIKKLREKYSDKEIIKVFEVFGVKELLE
ncbi:MAG: NADH:ubiquinone oxidoreductase [Parcubacteria group bacterium]